MSTEAPQEEAFDPNTQGAIKNLRGMEQEWTIVGRAFLGLCLIVGLIWLLNNPLTPSGKAVDKGSLPDVTLKATNFAFFTVVLHIFTGFLCFMWMLADIVHRRNRFTWLLPYLTCCAFGQHWIPLLFYFWLGRKRPT